MTAKVVLGPDPESAIGVRAIGVHIPISSDERNVFFSGSHFQYLEGKRDLLGQGETLVGSERKQVLVIIAPDEACGLRHRA